MILTSKRPAVKSGSKLTRAEKRKLREATIFHRKRIVVAGIVYPGPERLGTILQRFLAVRGWGTQQGGPV